MSTFKLCCEQGQSQIEYRTANATYGPEEAGWSIACGMTDYGAAHTYMNIAYCPFCGQDLASYKPEGHKRCK